jgi:hypothetical protein
MTSFVETLPSLIPQIADDVVQGGEDAISIIVELCTNPGGALTVIEEGAESIYSDVTAGIVSVFSDITQFFGCDIGGDCATTTGNAFGNSCSQLMNGSPTTAQSTSAMASNTIWPNSGDPTITAMPTTSPGSAGSSSRGGSGTGTGNEGTQGSSDGNPAVLPFQSRSTLIASLLVVCVIGFAILS